MGGHTAEALFFGYFLSFYLNAKLKAFSDYHTSIWKMFLVLSPLLGALFIAASVTMHHVSVKCAPSVKNLNSSLAYALQTRARVTQIFLKFVSAEPPLTNLVVLIAPPRPRCPPLNSHRYSHCPCWHTAGTMLLSSITAPTISISPGPVLTKMSILRLQLH